MVFHASGRAITMLGLLRKSRILRAHGGTTDQQGAAQPAGFGKATALLVDLLGELAGWAMMMALLAGSFINLCNKGMAKAAVLPVPVLAMPMTSLPASACGMAWSWMGDGVMKPLLITFCLMSGVDVEVGKAVLGLIRHLGHGLSGANELGRVDILLVSRLGVGAAAGRHQNSCGRACGHGNYTESCCT